MPLSSSEIAFIQTHIQADVRELMLRKKAPADVRLAVCGGQIQARQKAKSKLPTWVQNFDLVFPPQLNIEQGSSEQTASFKANIVNGQTFADLTGGMGIDFSAMSQNFERAYYVDKNTELFEISEHNFTVLGIKNQTCFNANAITFLERTSETFDWIYLDPARRDDVNKKMVLLENCEPNVLFIKELLLSKARNVLLKTSPMLDIDLAIRQLKSVQKVWVLAVEGEVKEILFQLSKHENSNPEIVAVQLSKNAKQNYQYSFDKQSEQGLSVRLSQPLRYLYEPNAALLKAGVFKGVAQHFGLAKLHPHSHLYTSDELGTDFFGRIFEVLGICKLDKKELINMVPNKQVNITVRNFPLTVAEIRKKTGLSEGGDTYVFATTLADERKVLVMCRKV